MKISAQEKKKECEYSFDIEFSAQSDCELDFAISFLKHFYPYIKVSEENKEND